MSSDLTHRIQNLHAEGQYLQIVQWLSLYSYDKLPEDINIPIVMEAIIRTLRSCSDEDEIEKTARLVWQFELQGLLTRNDVEDIRHAIGEDFLNAKGITHFFLGSADLIHRIQNLHAEGQSLQIVQRLYKFHELPAGIDVPIVVNAIMHAFHSASNKDELMQTDTVMVRLKLKGYLNRNDLDKIFHAVGEVILNTPGELSIFLTSALMSSYNEKAPENLIRIYAQAKTLEARSELADLIGAFCKEKGLLALVDNLYSQQIIRNDSIRAFLEKHSLLADIHLEPKECEVFVSTVLDFLKIPGPTIDSWDDEKKFKVDIINRMSAARILVVLNRYPHTPKRSRAKIQSEGDLIVTYDCVDRMYDSFVEVPLRRYLAGHIN